MNLMLTWPPLSHAKWLTMTIEVCSVAAGSASKVCSCNVEGSSVAGVLEASGWSWSVLDGHGWSWLVVVSVCNWLGMASNRTGWEWLVMTNHTDYGEHWSLMARNAVSRLVGFRCCSSPGIPWVCCWSWPCVSMQIKTWPLPIWPSAAVSCGWRAGLWDAFNPGPLGESWHLESHVAKPPWCCCSWLLLVFSQCFDGLVVCCKVSRPKTHLLQMSSMTVNWKSKDEIIIESGTIRTYQDHSWTDRDTASALWQVRLIGWFLHVFATNVLGCGTPQATTATQQAVLSRSWAMKSFFFFFRCMVVNP